LQTEPKIFNPLVLELHKFDGEGADVVLLADKAI
jgi:hypothetical protein